MKQPVLSFLFLLCAVQFALSLGVDRLHPFQDLTNTNCNTKSFSACAVRNAYLLVTQVLQDLEKASSDSERFGKILETLNRGGPQYRLGDGFGVSVYVHANLTKVADSLDNSTVGKTLGAILEQSGVLTSATLEQDLIAGASASGRWLDDTYFLTGKSNAIPTWRKTWVDGALINNKVYIATSSFDYVDPQLIGRPCDASKFADCSVDIAQNLVGLVAKELTFALPSQLPSFWTNVNTNAKYKVPVGFSVTVASSDGTILAHSGAGQMVGKKLDDISGGSAAAFAAAAAAGGLWVVHQWSDGGATYERQSLVVPVKPTDGNTYFVFSGHGTAPESKCPPCVCPTCPPVNECPLCPAITPCDGTEVTKLKIDLQNLI